MIFRSVTTATICCIGNSERIEGVTLDEEHLRYVRQHPIDWRVDSKDKFSCFLFEQVVKGDRMIDDVTERSFCQSEGCYYYDLY